MPSLCVLFVCLFAFHFAGISLSFSQVTHRRLSHVIIFHLFHLNLRRSPSPISSYRFLLSVFLFVSFSNYSLVAYCWFFASHFVLHLTFRSRLVSFVILFITCKLPPFTRRLWRLLKNFLPKQSFPCFRIDCIFIIGNCFALSGAEKLYAMISVSTRFLSREGLCCVLYELKIWIFAL